MRLADNALFALTGGGLCTAGGFIYIDARNIFIYTRGRAPVYSRIIYNMCICLF